MSLNEKSFRRALVLAMLLLTTGIPSRGQHVVTRKPSPARPKAEGNAAAKKNGGKTNNKVHDRAKGVQGKGIRKPAPSTDLAFAVEGVGFVMKKVEGGTFTMGATPEQERYAKDWEKPPHEVTLNGFFIGKYEVTQRLWRVVMHSNPSVEKGDDLPVSNVTRKECDVFIGKLNAMTGRQFRLPTEAEWEYAARGGNKSLGYVYSGSDNCDEVAWYEKDSGGKLHAVGTKKPNELGIYDMNGNAAEWVQDGWSNYTAAAQVNPKVERKDGEGGKSGRLCKQR